MNKLKKEFINKHIVLPVIHVESESQALCNVEIAEKAGCDGVFLINHAITHFELIKIQGIVRQKHPKLWIGINCLTLEKKEVFKVLNNSINGVWIDNAWIDEESEKQTDAEEIKMARNESKWEGVYFGGVAFKYYREVPFEKLGLAARISMNYLDVVTTSGPGTGRPASREKILTMKKALGEFPLAIASGITPENVSDYLDIADCFLVATGISSSFTELDPELVKKLVERIRGYENI